MEDWKQAVKDRVVSPTVALRGYGGGGINIIGQLECTISQGPFSQTAMVLIQKDAPLDLLIGTDFQPYLGFLILKKESEQKAIDMMQKEEQRILTGGADQEMIEGSPTDAPTSTAVCLLQAARLPPRHSKYMRGRVNHIEEQGPLLFVPGESLSDYQGLVIETGVTQRGEETYVTLIAQNHSNQPLHLEEGLLLGHVESVSDPEFTSATVRMLTVDDQLTSYAHPPAKERGEEVRKALNLKSDTGQR